MSSRPFIYICTIVKKHPTTAGLTFYSYRNTWTLRTYPFTTKFQNFGVDGYEYQDRFVRRRKQLGGRLRFFSDNGHEHTALCKEATRMPKRFGVCDATSTIDGSRVRAQLEALRTPPAAR